MRLFRKNNDVEQKLTEPHQQSTWLVWLLSIVTFFLTVAIVLGLFWAGRWVIHQFTKKPVPTTTPAISNTRDQAKSGSGSANTGSAGTTPPSSSSTPQTSPTPTPTPVQSSPTPSTPTHLVNTGPSSDE